MLNKTDRWDQKSQTFLDHVLTASLGIVTYSLTGFCWRWRCPGKTWHRQKQARTRQHCATSMWPFYTFCIAQNMTNRFSFYKFSTPISSLHVWWQSTGKGSCPLQCRSQTTRNSWTDPGKTSKATRAMGRVLFVVGEGKLIGNRWISD